MVSMPRRMNSLAVSRENWECAGRLSAAADVQRAHTGLHRDPADEVFLAPLIAKAQAGAGADVFVASKLEGRALSYQEAIIQARIWLESK